MSHLLIEKNHSFWLFNKFLWNQVIKVFSTKTLSKHLHFPYVFVCFLHQYARSCVVAQVRLYYLEHENDRSNETLERVITLLISKNFTTWEDLSREWNFAQLCPKNWHQFSSLDAKTFLLQGEKVRLDLTQLNIHSSYLKIFFRCWVRINARSQHLGIHVLITQQYMRTPCEDERKVWQGSQGK